MNNKNNNINKEFRYILKDLDIEHCKISKKDNNAEIILPKRYEVKNSKYNIIKKSKNELRNSQKLLDNIGSKMNALSKEQLNLIEQNGDIFINKIINNKNSISSMISKNDTKQKIFEDIFINYNKINKHTTTNYKSSNNLYTNNNDEAINNLKEVAKKNDYYEVYNKTILKQKLNNKSSNFLNIKEIKENKSVITINDKSNIDTNKIEPENNIFKDQIIIEYNGNDKSNTYIIKESSNSLPKLIDNNIKYADLLTRAKNGIKEGDLQKESYLNFYLAITIENNKNYLKSIIYYKRYFTNAKKLEDKFGMCFALNRIGVNYYKIGDIEKSLKYNLKNIKLNNFENIYVSYYNCGICYRLVNDFENSFNYFNQTLNWANLKHNSYIKSLVLGQLGINYYYSKAYEESINYLLQANEIGAIINNTKIILDSLIIISKIKFISKSNTKANNEEVSEHQESLNYFNSALSYAKQVNDKKNVENCIINLGILNGSKKFEDFIKNFNK